jgi:hypothetical protein
MYDPVEVQFSQAKGLAKLLLALLLEIEPYQQLPVSHDGYLL